MTDTDLRESIARFGESLFRRGLSFGASGNISVRVDDGWLMTPTGASLGALDPARLARLDASGAHVDGDAPTKEAFLHTEFYRANAKAGAIVHLHATHSVAVSCLDEIDPRDVLPPLTAYYVMRVGTLPLIPYFAPGDVDLAKAVHEMASKHHAVLLANHGPVVAGRTLADAVYAAEELEETARLFLLLKNHRSRPLEPAQVAALKRKFPSPL